jgi:hypothetical protein
MGARHSREWPRISFVIIDESSWWLVGNWEVNVRIARYPGVSAIDSQKATCGDLSMLSERMAI